MAASRVNPQMGKIVEPAGGSLGPLLVHPIAYRKHDTDGYCPEDPLVCRP